MKYTSQTLMIHQLEITTRCNFDCYYCAGRAMKQQDMSWDRFTAIIDSINPTEGKVVVLQGEGEPTLHPRFFAMARVIQTKGLIPNSTINGNRIDCEQLESLFPTITISIDTFDEDEAKRTGRHNLPKVLANVIELAQVMAPSRINIQTVNYGQQFADLVDWCKMHNLIHKVKPLQQKFDRSGQYVIEFPNLKQRTTTCVYVQQPKMRFYPVEGPTLPCCFIKDATGINSIEHLAARLSVGDTPDGCKWCRFLT